MIALLSTTRERAVSRLREEDPQVQITGNRAQLSDGRQVVIATTERELQGRVLSGFWIEGFVFEDLVRLAEARVINRER
ncbi:MAG: hypothetical protein AAFR84_21875 [Pseudomonadota bacterium]